MISYNVTVSKNLTVTLMITGRQQEGVKDMPYDAYGNEIPSKADKKNSFLSFGDIGGVGQLVYHNFRFADYSVEYDDHNEMIAIPVVGKDALPDIEQRDDLDGKKILTSLCDLARRIDSYDTKEAHQDLIVEWCRSHMHPYRIDAIFEMLSLDGFCKDELLVSIAGRDGVFSIDRFMKDLGQLYNAARFHLALEGVAKAEEHAAYNLYQEGRFFESSALFEKFKRREPDLPDDFDFSAAGGNLAEELRLANEYIAAHPVEQPPEGEFAEEPYDHYEELRDAMLGFFPDFKLRLKYHPKKRRIILSADVDSVFEIAWYALAHLITEEPVPEEVGKEADRPEGMLTCCKYCGRFFIRRSSRNEYCDRTECQKARNAKNQREFRERRRQKKARTKE